MKYKFRKNDFEEKFLKRFEGKGSVLKFPIDLWTVEGGEFLGDLLTDGYFQTDRTVGYSNSDPQQILKNIQSVAKLFAKKALRTEVILSKISHSKKKLKKLSQEISSQINIRTRITHKKTCYVVNYSAILGLILEKIGIPKGKRCITNPPLPKVISKAPIKVISAFLRRVITNEATITHDGQVCIKEVVIEKKKPKLLEGYRKLFEKLGIKTTKPRISRKYYGKYGLHVAWEIYTRPYDLNKILENINIDSKYKVDKIISFLKSKKRFRLTRKERIKQIILLVKKKQPVSLDNLLSSIDIKRSSLQDYLYRMMKMGLVTRSGHKFYPSGSEPFLYFLTKKSEKFGSNTNCI